MGLDITFTQRKKNVCPHCGKITGQTDVNAAPSGGRVWYPFLESIGYFLKTSNPHALLGLVKY